MLSPLIDGETGSKKFPCDVCNKSYVTEPQLWKHIKSKLHQKRLKASGGNMDSNFIACDDEIDTKGDIKIEESSDEENELKVSYDIVKYEDNSNDSIKPRTEFKEDLEIKNELTQ